MGDVLQILKKKKKSIFRKSGSTLTVVTIEYHNDDNNTMISVYAFSNNNASYSSFEFAFYMRFMSLKITGFFLSFFSTFPFFFSFFSISSKRSSIRGHNPMLLTKRRAQLMHH